MRRLMVFVLALAAAMGVIGVVPTAAGALPPDFVAPPFSIIGTVTDENGNPLPGITVTDSDFFTLASTDADGQYLLEGLQAGNTYVVTATDPNRGHSPASSDPVVVSDTEGAVASTIVMQTVATTSISGTVTDTAGAPIAGAIVSDNFSGASTTTAGDGSYTLTGLIGGETYALAASDPTGLHGSVQGDVGIVAGDGTTVVNLTLPNVVVAIAGTVTDPEGAPVAGARVQLLGFFGFSKTTGPDGRFALADIPDGEYSVSIDPTSVRPELRPVDVPVTVVAGTVADASVQLTRTATLDLTVTAGGAPASAEISLWSEAFGRVGFFFTDTNGLATVPVVNDGTYYLQIDSLERGYASEFYPSTIDRAAAQRFTIAGEQHIPVAVELEAAAVIEGTITLPDGSPGDYTQVSAQLAGPTDAGSELSPCNLPSPDDPPGTYRIGCLHPSVDWIIKGFGQGAADDTYYRNSQSPFNATPIAVEPGQTVSGIDLRLAPKSPTPSFAGLSQSYFLTGTTTAGVRMFGSSFPTDPHALQLLTSTFGFGPEVFVDVTSVVSRTEAVVTVRVSAGVVGPTPIARGCFLRTTTGSFVDLPDCIFVGDTTTRVGAISGRVVGPRGASVRGATVQFVSSDGTIRRTVTTDAQGRYTGAGLPPARYRVQFDGTETLSGEYWKDTTNPARATLVTVRAGRTEKAVDAELAPRSAITISTANPNAVQYDNVSFDLIGTGLGAITGGFRVSVGLPFGGRASLDSTSAGSTRLHVTAFPFLLPPGRHDLLVEWTGADGAVRSTTCVQCLTVYWPLGLSFGGFITAGATADVVLGGSGIIDITDVTIDGTGITVDGFHVDESSQLIVTLTASADATPNPDTGGFTLTVTRADGASGTSVVFLEQPV